MAFNNIEDVRKTRLRWLRRVVDNDSPPQSRKTKSKPNRIENELEHAEPDAHVRTWDGGIIIRETESGIEADAPLQSYDNGTAGHETRKERDGSFDGGTAGYETKMDVDLEPEPVELCDRYYGTIAFKAEPLSPEEEAELFPEGEGTVSASLARLIFGESTDPHILDFSAQIPPIAVIHGEDPDDRPDKPAYWNSLRAIFADPPTPTLFTYEHNRKRFAIQAIHDVHTAKFYDDYSDLASKVEFERSQDGDWFWTLDTQFTDRPGAEQVKVVDKWLARLCREAAKLRARPYYWCIRVEESGEYDLKCYPYLHTPEININEEEFMADQIFVEVAEEVDGFEETIDPIQGLKLPLRGLQNKLSMNRACQGLES